MEHRGAAVLGDCVGNAVLAGVSKLTASSESSWHSDQSLQNVVQQQQCFAK